MTSLKTSWAISLSPFFVLRKFSIKCVADGCKMQKRCDKMAKFGLQLAISQHLWVSTCSCSTPFNLLFPEISNQATLKPPGFENGNLDRPKPGMLIPNMFCTFVQIPHHDLVPFSALQINDLFLWSVGINLYHNKAHISKLSGF